MLLVARSHSPYGSIILQYTVYVYAFTVDKPTLRVRGARVCGHRLARRQARVTVTGKPIRD
jgi:hypothetical protein